DDAAASQKSLTRARSVKRQKRMRRASLLETSVRDGGEAPESRGGDAPTSGARLPVMWISLSMEHSDHQDLTGLNAVQHGVREAAHGGAADILEDFGVQSWAVGNAVEYLLHARNEVHAKADALLFVPIERLVELGSRFNLQDDGQTHRRALARASALTCSQ